jgi:glycosyltransferase involved in cell wall biosynthesis
MDRYASRLAIHLRRDVPDMDFTLACEIAGPTVEAEGPVGEMQVSAATQLPLLPWTGRREFGRYLSRYWRYPRRVWRMRGDILHILDHSYAHILLSKRDRPTVVTVHDLAPLLTVQRRGRMLRERFRDRLLRRVLEGLQRADAWIVATQWLRGQLANRLERDDHIHVIPFGVDDTFFDLPSEPRAETRGRWGIPDAAFVVLHVGSVGPRKNLGAVIATVHGLRTAGVEAWFLQVGGILTPAQQADLASRGISQFARCVGEAGERSLRAAYRAADVLLFPSHYEGFGFPVLEAMASRLPVVTSGAGGVAEVAGDAAVVVGSPEPEPYVAALKQLVGNGSWREHLVAKGVERARRFRWPETARKTSKVYRALA